MLTEPAFNALLKTLEEPPQQVVFILATTEPQKLPLTIISRTQRFDFKLANETNLATKLERIIKAEGFTMSIEALDLVIKAGQKPYWKKC
jgi:DNA polymerase-3 subunit gamma/tau